MSKQTESSSPLNGCPCGGPIPPQMLEGDRTYHCKCGRMFQAGDAGLAVLVDTRPHYFAALMPEWSKP